MHLYSIAGALFLAATASSQVTADERAPNFDYYRRPKTCTGSTLTTIALSTIPTVITSYITTSTVVTVPTTATFPYSCYTQLIPVPQSNNDFCGTWANTCNPVTCTTTSTFTQPCRDPCCPTTTTVNTLGGCRTCDVGCATATTYVPQSTGCPRR